MLDRLLIIAPWRLDRRCRSHRDNLSAFQQVTSKLKTVRAGQIGIVEFDQCQEVFDESRLLQSANHWKSVTPYQPTRYPKDMDQAQTEIEADLIGECIRRNLPRPKIEMLSIHAGPRGGFRAYVRLEFAVAVSGPLILGRDSHQGGGLFCTEK